MPGKNRPSRKAKNDRRMAAYIERKERERDQEASGGLDVSGPVEEEEEEPGEQMGQVESLQVYFCFPANL